jgi:hypothetical protein
MSLATMVQFFIGGELVKSHPRKARGKQTDFGDYPPFMWNQRGCQARCCLGSASGSRAGPSLVGFGLGHR